MAYAIVMGFSAVAERLETTPARGERPQQILRAARQLLEQAGPAGVSMRRIAHRIGIRAPSLYKHFPDKSAVEVALTAQALQELAEALEAAEAADGPAALTDLTAAYRSYALAHPQMYRLIATQPLERAALPDGLEQRAAAPLLRATGGDIDIARAVWAFAHGMVMLELNKRFPPDADVDAAWRTGCAVFQRTNRRNPR
jgi:AcrR family transcriptional regulator